jgi:uncharacterized membrane protein YbhN (UPF0104 family)
MRPRVRWWAGLPLLVVAVVVLVPAVDLAALRAAAVAALRDPVGLAGVTLLYAGAFVVRAGLLHRVLPSVSFGQALAALHVGLAGNHLLPLRMGEVLRVTSLVRRTPAPLDAAAAVTLGLRAADLLAVLAIAAVLGPRAVAGTAGAAGWLLVVPAALVLGGAGWWLRRRGLVARLPVALVGAGSLLAWVLEAGLVWQTARWAGVTVDPLEALLVTAVTIAAQTLAVAPGGVGTYEAAATAAFVALGADPAPALAAALLAHALKTIYALATGAVAAFTPAPTLFGHLRLRPAARVPLSPVGEGPVVFFFPAWDEAAAVGGVVARVPAVVRGREVRVLVVDDGSSDGTAEVAGAAGAEVIGQEHRGLGAAVRRGLSEGLARGAAVVVFADADGEYAPEELERLVAPILAAEADYVVGSRFAGLPRAMRPHRELGNRLLTAALRMVARTPISDGQSGYRALSARAAADAEVIHDYNYAQVLTLDLLAKGYRYAEVPISYRFRGTGRSFIRLGAYLRHVLPAVHRELNAPSAPTAPSPPPAPTPVGAAARSRPADA